MYVKSLCLPLSVDPAQPEFKPHDPEAENLPPDNVA